MINIIIPTIPGNDAALSRCLSYLFSFTKQEFKLIIIKNEVLGFAKAINLGLKYIDDDCVLMNDDAIPTEGWLDELLEARVHSDIICQQGQLRPEHSPFFCIYIKKKVVDKIGLLDEGFNMGDWEDVDYCIRALDAGFKLGETKKLTVFHPEPSTTFRKFSDDFNNIRKKNTKEYFMKKWKGTKWEKRLDGSEW